MAQVYYDPYPAAQFAPQAPRAEQPAQAHIQAQAASGGGVVKLINLAGAALSVALIAGVSVWSYRLMVRDVSGIPVIQALDLPVRVAPDDPGGRQAAYQGLAVNTVAAEGEAAGPAPVIALAPPPVELRAEDRAAAELVASAERALISAPATPARLEPHTVIQAAPHSLTLVSPDLPGVSRSLFPRARPANAPTRLVFAPQPLPADLVAADTEAEAVLQDIAARLSTPSVIDIDPTTLVPGTRLVQFGAFDTEQEASDYWAGLTSRFGDYLEGRGRVVEAATAGGRTFYRLRAHGFSDEPQARQFCSIFLAENVDCIPVLIR